MQTIVQTRSQAIACIPQANATLHRQRAVDGIGPGALGAVCHRIVRLIDQASPRRAGQALALHVVAVWSRFLGWQMRRATRLLLSSLDERTLADIGVHRSEIDTVLRDMEMRKARWYVNR